MSAPRNPALDQDDLLAAECLGLFGIDLEVMIQFRRSGYQALQGVTCEFHEGTAAHSRSPADLLPQADGPGDRLRGRWRSLGCQSDRSWPQTSSGQRGPS